MKTLRYIALAILLAAGCTRLHPAVSEPQLSLETKASASLPVGSTYRIMMFKQNDRSYMAANTGTYYAKEGVSYLVACNVKQDGTYDGEDETKGINGVNDDVYVVLSSPGKSSYNDGSFDFNPESPADFLVNAPERKRIGTYGKITLNNPLYSPFSTIQFEFYKKPEVADFTIKNGVVNVIGVQAEDETVKVYPAIRQVRMAASGGVRSVILTQDLSHAVEPSRNYECFYKTSDENVLQIASGIYAPKEEVATYLGMDYTTNLLDGNHIYMSCTIMQGERPLDIRLPLNDKSIEMLPQHHYVYKFFVESDYISVSLDVYNSNSGSNDWENPTDGTDGDTTTSTVGTLVNTISIGSWTGDGWQSSGDIGFEIG